MDFMKIWLSWNIDSVQLFVNTVAFPLGPNLHLHLTPKQDVLKTTDWWFAMQFGVWFQALGVRFWQETQNPHADTDGTLFA